MKMILHTVFAIFLVATSLAMGQQLSIASVSSAGIQTNDYCLASFISGDGRFVAFESKATNLVPGDTNARVDVFVRDLQTGQTARVSVSSAGAQGNFDSNVGAISFDGRFVAFSSDSTTFVAGDTNGYPDIFVRDRQTNTTTRVSVSSTGAEANNGSYSRICSFSADGRFVAFQSHASNLIAGDLNNLDDIFVHDRQTGITTRESVGIGGVEGTGGSRDPSLSSDGRYVAFQSNAGNLFPGLQINWDQIYRRDRVLGTTELVSIRTPFDPANPGGGNPSSSPTISADGNIITFRSSATNLVAYDNNGATDVFVRDMSMNYIDCVSISLQGNTGNSNSFGYPAISADGRYVLFQSAAKDLVPETAGGSLSKGQWFRRDLLSGQTVLLTKTPAGLPSNQLFTTDQPAGISSDGQVATFETDATNLGPTDTNVQIDIYVYQSAPVVQSSSPPCGPLAGGTKLMITGQSFGAPGGSINVTVGGAPASNITILSSTSLTCLAPAGSAGVKDIVVTAPHGSASLVLGYTHTADLQVYGTGMPGCLGVEEIAAVALPKAGETNFGFFIEKAPANALGLALITNSQDANGSDPFGLGIILLIDFTQATDILAFDAVSDADGHGVCAAPIPLAPALVGTNWYVQTIWLWSSCPLPPLNLSSSRAVRLTVAP